MWDSVDKMYYSQTIYKIQNIVLQRVKMLTGNSSTNSKISTNVKPPQSPSLFSLVYEWP